MGFLDKAKENLEKVAKQGQDKLDEVQSKKKADGLLRDLGAWTYATSTGRDSGKGPAEVQRITAELQAHEAEHGALGGDKPAEGDAGPGDGADAGAAAPATGSEQPHAPAPMMPPAPAGIVPPPPPRSDHGTPAGSVPPPPTFAPPPPVEGMPEGGSKLDEF